MFLILARRSGLVTTELYKISGLAIVNTYGNSQATAGLLVLSDIVICTVLLVHPSEPFKTGVWHIFLVQAPADSSFLEQINNGRNILRNLGERVSIETKVVAMCKLDSHLADKNTASNIPSYCCHVVWLTRMSESKVVAQGDSLLGKKLEVCLRPSQLVSEPAHQENLRSAAAIS